MRFIRQLGVILGFAFAGDVVVRVLPGRLPAIVVGMVLMLGALGVRVLRPEHVGECADFLGGVMAFFFAPLSVAILQNYRAILPVLGQVLFIIVACTFVTFFVCYGTFRLLRGVQARLSQRRSLRGGGK